MVAVVVRCLCGGVGVPGGNQRAIGNVKGVFDILVLAMRRHGLVAEVQWYGCRALGQLASNYGECTRKFDSAPCQPPTSPVTTNRVRVRVDRHVSCVDRNQSAIGSVRGVFDLIVASMRRHQGVAEVQRWGCWALGQLACDNRE